MSALAERVQCLIHDLEEQKVQAELDEQRSPYVSQFAPEHRLAVSRRQLPVLSWCWRCRVMLSTTCCKHLH